jgi:hypothetical protein
LQQEDQDVDLPDLGDEGQAERRARPHHVEACKQRTPVHPVGEGAGNGGDADIGHHLDGEDRAQHHRCPVTREVIGQKAKGHCRQASAQQSHDLREEQVAVGPVGEDLQHGWSQR